MNMLGLGLFLVFGLTSLLSFIFYEFFSDESKIYLQEETRLLAEILVSENDKAASLARFGLPFEDSRITLINVSGTVIYDNYKDAKTMDNHSARPEFTQAMENGYREYRRFSDTIGEETYYYALRLDDNSVLRIAKTTQSIVLIFKSFLPWVLSAMLAVSLFVFWLSGRLTKKIMQPINTLQLDGSGIELYEELAPLVNKINEQNKQIDIQMDELKKRANTINAIIKDMQEGLIILDCEGTILAINSIVLEFWGTGHDDYIGKNILELVRDPIVIDKIKATLAGERQYIALDTDTKTIDVFCNPVLEKGEIIGANILFLDVTDKTAAERLRKEFSANVSHELKTPLTSILGYSEMLENGMAKQEDIEKFAGKIKNQVVHLKKLVDNIIKISELDENAPMSDFEMFDIISLTEDVVNDFAPLARTQDVNITVDNKYERLPVFANKTMITELMANLVDNAVKYNKTDGRVFVKFEDIDGKINIVVEDNGIGIEKDKLERVFERFYRVDPSRSKKTGGTGLGLSIVKHIAQYHGGKVSIDSTVGEGTTVTVSLAKGYDKKQ